jgi:hypothetical protein
LGLLSGQLNQIERWFAEITRMPRPNRVGVDGGNQEN